MNAFDLAQVRLRLQHRRREILETSRRTAGGIDQLRQAERDPEIEEASQSEQQQYDLAQLNEVEQREIAQIDAAIARLEEGEYGTCRGCGEDIDSSRLAASPFVLDCADCASHLEEAERIERELKKRARTMIPG
jgi:RNA polymerase-binding transcription factor